MNSYEFPTTPVSWHYACLRDELIRGPQLINLCGRNFVVYQTESGRVAVLDARCCHAGSNLASGKVSGERLCCPLHGWEYDPSGACVHIPTGDAIPRWARQTSFPVAEFCGHIFFFPQPRANFPLPGFAGVDPKALYPARSFELHVDAPWYIVSSNGFDLQHFRCSHNRVLISEPVVDCPNPFARRIVAEFQVSGSSWRDAVTRSVSGRTVRMEVTDWCGNLVFVTAKFARTTTYGLVCTHAIEPNRTIARTLVFVPRRHAALARVLVDPVDAWIRRWFIREFLRPDVERATGVRYYPDRLILSDGILRDYLEWLEQVHRRGAIDEKADHTGDSDG